MIPFYVFQIPNSHCPTLYSNYQAQELPTNMFIPSFMPSQSYVHYRFGPMNDNFSISSNHFASSNFPKQVYSTSNSFQKEINYSTSQSSKEVKQKQNRQKLNMTVPKTKFIEKKSKLKYLKKNTESNISNQVLAFLSDEKKSQRWIFKLCKNQNLSDKNLTSKFYEWMKAIKSRTKKYISKKILLNLSIPSKDHLLLKEFEKTNTIISSHDLNFFCKAIRILVRIFLTQYSPLTVLTSRKIHREGTSEHLTRRRQIKSYLQQQLMKL